MSTYIFILGKHPNLSIAELYGRYSDGDFRSIGDDFVVLDVPKQIDQKEFNYLGGSVKSARIIEESKKDNLIKNLSEVLRSYYQNTKLDYGLSLYGMSEKQLRPILLKLKKELKKNEIKSRFINRQFKNISAAQYKAIRKKGIELIVVKEKSRFLTGEVIGVQDIDAYSKRDYEKPFRDSRMGMLPPKLAQILINLTGVKGKIWDPFCGSGTLIMEGLLMGRDMLGSDIHPKRLEGAKKNVVWLKKEFDLSSEAQLFVHDATKPFTKFKFEAIACEADLGMPHGTSIRMEQLQKIMNELDQLYFNFFRALKNMSCDVPIVIALPFFRLQNGQEKDMQKTVERIEKIGFKRTPLLPDFIKGEDRFKLKYARPDQAVGRAIYRFIT